MTVNERADLNDVALFVRVVEEGTFAKVARDLGVPTSTVSRALVRLEAALGARLLERTTRAIRVTPEGRALFHDASAPIRALDLATKDAAEQPKDVRGLLRVTAATDVANAFLAGAVTEFTKRHPKIEVELVLSSKNVDLVRDGYDVAIRAGVLRDSTLIARRLASIGMQIFAAPSYVAEHGIPKNLRELAAHNCIIFRGKDCAVTWKLSRKGGTKEEQSVEVRGAVNTDDMAFVRALCLAGNGIALLPPLITREDVLSHRLVRILDGYEALGSGLFFVHAAHKHMPRKIEVFREFVTRALSDLNDKS